MAWPFSNPPVPESTKATSPAHWGGDDEPTVPQTDLPPLPPVASSLYEPTVILSRYSDGAARRDDETVTELEPEPEGQAAALEAWRRRFDEARQALSEPTEPGGVGTVAIAYERLMAAGKGLTRAEAAALAEPTEVHPIPVGPDPLDETSAYHELDEAVRRGDGTALRRLVGEVEPALPAPGAVYEEPTFVRADPPGNAHEPAEDTGRDVHPWDGASVEALAEVQREVSKLAERVTRLERRWNEEFAADGDAQLREVFRLARVWAERVRSGR